MGSTNLNLSSLGANWEIDLVAEDPAFAKKMEDLFEEDIANSREIHLVEPIKSGRQTQIRPDGPIDSADREARRGVRRGVVGSGSGASVTVTRVGSAVIQKSGAPLQTHEQAFAVGASAILLGAGLLGIRFPRFLAWPLATLGSFFGAIGILRAACSALSNRSPDQPETDSGNFRGAGRDS